MQRLLTLLVMTLVTTGTSQVRTDRVFWRNLTQQAKLAYAMGVQAGVDMAFRLHIHHECADCEDSEVVTEINALYSARPNLKLGDATAYVHMKLSGSTQEELRKFLADLR